MAERNEANIKRGYATKDGRVWNIDANGQPTTPMVNPVAPGTDPRGTTGHAPNTRVVINGFPYLTDANGTITTNASGDIKKDAAPLLGGGSTGSGFGDITVEDVHEEKGGIDTQPSPDGTPTPTPDGTPTPTPEQAPTADTPTIDNPLLPTTPQAGTGATEFGAATREVGENELVENRLTGLLDSDSKFIRQARLQGLEHGGGLGGTSGIRASVGAAIQAGMPIAIADAQAFRDAAAQNMNALNQFGLANIQRTTQLELANLDSATRITTTHMTNTMQTAIARLQSATQINMANLTAQTQIRVTELNGEIQTRLANMLFRHTQLLNDQTHGNELEQLALRGEYTLESQRIANELEQEINYVNTYMSTYNAALDRITALNGLEMDDNARRRAEDAIWEGAQGMFDLIGILYPDATPIGLEGSGEGDGTGGAGG